MQQTFHLAIATDYEYDEAFITLLEQSAHKSGLSTYRIYPYNLNETLKRLLHNDLEFGFYYDRASDSSPEFLKLYRLLSQKNVTVLDTWEDLCLAADKAQIHLKFQKNGIQVPYTIIIPPFDLMEGIYLSDFDLSRLGKPFVIKPAFTTGGGTGVVSDAKGFFDILQARKSFEKDKYLLQQKVNPQEKEGKRFWFRCFYVCGKIECAWWHDVTHIYHLLKEEEVQKYKLHPLFTIVEKIAEISKLHFFSTEIALNRHREFIVVDYINEVCDMRLKSQYPDGVPDEIVAIIAEQIALHVLSEIKT